VTAKTNSCLTPSGGRGRVRSRRTTLLAWWLAASLVGTAHAAAPALPLKDIGCPNSEILGAGLIDRICWSCLFPIALMGVELFNINGAAAPEGHANRGVCVCHGSWKELKLPTIGFSLGYWQPARLLELTRLPYCFPGLGGLRATMSLSTAGGAAQVGILSSHEVDQTLTEIDFVNIHYYAFPLFAILELLDLPSCNPDGYMTFDLLQIGEAYPNWYSDELSFLVQPESLVFANPFAQAAAMLECGYIAAMDKPIDNWWWTAGCWGMVYPFSGNMPVSSQIVNNWSLASTKFLYMLGRLKMIRRTVGNDALCDAQDMPILLKSQYRMQMAFPVAETDDSATKLCGNGGTKTPEACKNPPPAGGSGDGSMKQAIKESSFRIRKRCCHALGDSTLLWGDWRHIPVTGEDAVFVLWQWVDCCLGVVLDGTK